MERKDSIKRKEFIISMSLSTLFLLLCILFPIPSYAIDNSICARVKIEICQELTLERQAFEAHMRINNGLTHISLEDVDIAVTFSDEEGNEVLASYDPNDPNSLFFIRLDSMSNITDVNGAGVVLPSSSADINWLIIPAPGAANGLQQGTLYYVGATLTYTIGGEENITKVSPDYIFVKPMPELTLDYFLTKDVYGDDAFTDEIEPTIPFTLGVRVKNEGYGVARNLTIESAQPKIIENEMGLLIGFTIEGCEVNGKPATPSLLADFGDIEPQTSGSARWIMTCSLSGEFTEFTAEFFHSDELGGSLTSLINEPINTHFLVHDVLVDLPGRDHIRDFLAKDDVLLTVYESSGLDTEVVDQSAFSSLQYKGQSGADVIYTLSTPITDGFMYVQIPDPKNGQKVIREVIRSDGKHIKQANVWLSKSRDNELNWRHYVNLFDVNTTGSYILIVVDPEAINHSPVIEYIPERKGVEEEQLSFIMKASDQDGDPIVLTTSSLPVGAEFTDQGNGIGIFDWAPMVGQSGVYDVTFIASDGELEASRSARLIISPLSETENLPSVPIIVAPRYGAEVDIVLPDLVIQNSTDPDGDSVTYDFEIYPDKEMTEPVASRIGVVETEQRTTWTVPERLADNTWYYWRVRASDGIAITQWAYGRFFVNLLNDPPGVFNVSSPQQGGEVDVKQPVLEVTNSIDPDGDIITYAFEASEYEGMEPLAAYGFDIPEGDGGATSWIVSTELKDNAWYFWRATAIDEHDEATQTPVASFFINTLNNAPGAPRIYAPEIGSEIAQQEADLIVENATDPDGDVVTYLYELDLKDTFDSEHKQMSGNISEGLHYTDWYASGLEDNTFYFWRVRADDGAAQSLWGRGKFFVNTENDMPTTPTIYNPGMDAWVESLSPILKLNPSKDDDNDALLYRFEVFAADATHMLLARGESCTTEWAIPAALSNRTWYYWRAQAEDEHGGKSPWSEIARFFAIGEVIVCEGDFDADRDVDILDLAAFTKDFGRTDCLVGPPCKGDFDIDGDVDVKDLSVFSADFGRTDCSFRPPLCEGDFDRDGDVDVFDLGTFAKDFGKTGCDAESPCRGDFDRDGDMDVFDLGVFATDFGRTNCPLP